jgi:WD40 repeat protein
MRARGFADVCVLAVVCTPGAVCAGGAVYVLGAFDGNLLHRFAPPPAHAAPPPHGHGHAPQQAAALPLEATFTPDARHVLCGGGDGLVRAWSTAHGGEVAAWRGHSGVPSALRWSPRRALAASGCTHGGVALWVPPPPGEAAAHAAAQHAQQQAAAQQQMMMQPGQW